MDRLPNIVLASALVAVVGSFGDFPAWVAGSGFATMFGGIVAYVALVVRASVGRKQTTIN